MLKLDPVPETGAGLNLLANIRSSTMKYLCIIAAVSLLVIFTAVNLFLPYALLVLALFIPLGFACKVISRSRGRECRLGFC